MSDTQRMLIIQACGTEGEEAECLNIQSQADLYGLDVTLRKPRSVKEFTEALYEDSWHYLYVSCHGDEEGICASDKSIKLSWNEFSELLCWTQCLEPECKILLSCCRGGLNTVAYELTAYCYKVSYIIGPRQKLGCEEMLAAFNVFLYLSAFKDMDPVIACEKVVKATDLRLICFDRLELESDLAYIRHRDELREKWDSMTEEERKERNQRLIDYGVDPKTFEFEEDTDPVDLPTAKTQILN